VGNCVVNCYVLHSYPWKESSLIVELISADDGRVSAVAKGARRASSVYRGLLQPFNKLDVRYGKNGDLRSLLGAEWIGASNHRMLSGSSLFSGFYINELLLKLMQKHDPCPKLFSIYESSLKQLSSGIFPSDLILRRFEISLLLEMGVFPDFEGILKNNFKKNYFISATEGIISEKEINLSDSSSCRVEKFLSREIIKIFSGNILDLNYLQESVSSKNLSMEIKGILRTLIDGQLSINKLSSRRIVLDLNEYTKLGRKN
tara:strand:+ start:24000 stop:24776 length:777 start_codon:yes stop_codon:yes gene_type:complete